MIFLKRIQLRNLTKQYKINPPINKLGGIFLKAMKDINEKGTMGVRYNNEENEHG